MGTLIKENPSGKFISEYKSNLDSCGHEFEKVDVGSGLALTLAVKDEEEIVRFGYLISENN